MNLEGLVRSRTKKRVTLQSHPYQLFSRRHSAGLTTQKSQCSRSGARRYMLWPGRKISLNLDIETYALEIGPGWSCSRIIWFIILASCWIFYAFSPASIASQPWWSLLSTWREASWDASSLLTSRITSLTLDVVLKPVLSTEEVVS